MPTSITLRHAALHAHRGNVPAALQEPSFGSAMDHLEAGRWQAAFEALAALAQGGHPAAARIALMMASRGGPLLGGCFRATAQDLARWRQVAG